MSMDGWILDRQMDRSMCIYRDRDIARKLREDVNRKRGGGGIQLHLP